MISNGTIEEKIIINGLGINYKMAGEGQPLLVLHGWGGSSDSWMEVMNILSQKGHKIICLDLPGFGKSAPPSRAWTLQDYTDFISKFVEELNLESFSLLGHSFGGRMAVKFCLQYPQKIKKLILCAAIKQKPSLKTIIIFYIAKFGNALFTPKPLKRFKDAARNLLYIFLRNRDYAKAKGIMKEIMKNILAEDLLSELMKINTETLLVWGDKDKMVPVKYSYIHKERIRNSKLEIFSNIGHSPHLEIPEKLSQTLINFLK